MPKVSSLELVLVGLVGMVFANPLGIGHVIGGQQGYLPSCNVVNMDSFDCNQIYPECSGLMAICVGCVKANTGKNADGLCEVDPNPGHPCGNISGRCFSINNSRKSLVGINGQICVGSQCP